ncbi:MAG: GtrA family protein [Granulosicoccus sp.]
MPSKRFIRFLVAGGVAASLNFGSRFVFSMFMDFEFAIVCSYLVGMASGFIFFKLLVFGPTDNSVQTQISAYTVVNMIALLQTWVVALLMAKALVPMLGVEKGEALAHLCGIVVPAITSYFGHKYLTFK